MTLTLQLSDEQASALEARASALGLSIEGWIQRLASVEPDGQPHRHIADLIAENMRSAPPEIMTGMPPDGASQHDHYIYGWPKQGEPQAGA